jgi:hypothetical protein
MAAQMSPLVNEVQQAISAENLLAASALNLALPDICGSIDTPKEQVGCRYRCWWNHYCRERFKFGDSPRCLAGREVYKLRCAYLHQGYNSFDPDRDEDIGAITENFEFRSSAVPVENEERPYGVALARSAMKRAIQLENEGRKRVATRPRNAGEGVKITEDYVNAQTSVQAKSSMKVTPPPIKKFAQNVETNFPPAGHESLCSNFRDQS